MDYFIDFENYLGSQDWLARRYDYTSGNIDYMGKHLEVDAAASDDSWYIWKYTYDGSDNLTLMQGPLVGSWDGRAGLGWS